MDYIVKFYELMFFIGVFVGPLFIIVVYIQFGIAYKATTDKLKNEQAKKLLASHLQQNSNKPSIINFIYGAGSESVFVVEQSGVRQYYYVFLKTNTIEPKDIGATQVYDLLFSFLYKPIVKLSRLSKQLLHNVYVSVLGLLLIVCSLIALWFFFW